MTQYGLKIAQPGKSVETTFDYNLVFSTLFSTLPIYTEIYSEQSIAGTTIGTFTFKHGLTFVPFVLYYYKTQDNPDKWQWWPANSNLFFFSSDPLQPNGFRVDRENIVVKCSNTGPSTKILTIRLVVFAFPIAMSI